MRHVFPYARAGARIGLLGGSFDPAHDGHRQITLAALRRFGFDQVWWLVSPGNPLKSHGPAGIEDRITRAHSVMSHPRVVITGIEADLGTRYTAKTLAALIGLYPGVRFSWLMGADNLIQFDKWQDWQWIMDTVPVGILARPGSRIAARTSRAAQIYRAAQIPASHSRALPCHAAPAWCFLNIPMNAQSSSNIRARTNWGQTTPQDQSQKVSP